MRMNAFNWPRLSPPITARLARIAIGAGSAFPNVLKAVRTWLLPVA